MRRKEFRTFAENPARRCLGHQAITGALMRADTQRRHRGFTLLELLVVIGIISLLLVVGVPAVQQAREAARRMQCRSHLKQIALALHSYHESALTFPSAAYCGVRGTSSIQHCHTWMESLLPFIGEQATYAKIDFNIANHLGANPAALNDFAPSLLICPSDTDAGLMNNAREPNYTPGPGRSLGASYVGNAGPLNMNICPIPARTPNFNCLSREGARHRYDAPGMFSGGWRGYTFEDCLDGASNTFLLGETLPIYSTFHMYFASHLHIGSTNPPPNYHLRYKLCPKAPDERLGIECFAHMGGFMSPHGGIVNMAYTDGSVQSIAEGIDYETWCNLSNKADANPPPAF